MSSFSQHRLEELKKNLIAVAGISNMLPSECRALSDSIFKKTTKRVSETTLKRVYGFAHSKFNPSLFTIDAMAQYCGHKSWGDYCESKEIQEHEGEGSTGWNAIKQSAGKITNFTLQALKNRSGIPYNHTIKRKFTTEHFDTFLQEDFTATALTAPSGYGKTIALCQWIDEQRELNITARKNDIFLFFSSTALVNSTITGRNLNEWLLSLLGCTAGGDLTSLLDDSEKKEGKFYLIIDSFDEHLFKIDQFQLLLSQLVDIIGMYKNHPWFKVILTMRSATWINNKHTIINGKSNWFPGFVSYENRSINMPLFDLEDINNLCSKIYPENKPVINIETAQVLSNPLYFQFYYQSHSDSFCFEKIDQLSIHELIAKYILNKIYLGPYASEKLLLIQGLIAQMDFLNKTYKVDKLKVYDLVKKYAHAYHDLLSLGYLRELNTTNEVKFENFIEFGNANYLAHAVAQTFLFNNNNLFNDELILTINNTIKSSAHKLVVLKWCVMFAVKNGQFEQLKSLSRACLLATERCDLIIFIRDLFDKELAKQNTDIEKLFIQPDSAELFNYFFGVEFINIEYENSLQTLLKFELRNTHKISIYTSLAIISVIQMDINKLEEHLSKLKSFPPEEFENFPVNPLNCLDTIYTYLKYGIIKREAFAELTGFYFNPPTTPSATTSSSTNDVLYLLGIFTLAVNLNPHKSLRFINAVNRVYNNETPNDKGYGFALRIATVETLLSLNKINSALTIYDRLVSDFEFDKSAYTPFIKALFYQLKVRITILTTKKADVPGLMKPLVHLADESGYKLIKVHSLVLILANHQKLKEDGNYYKKVYYDFIKIVGESGFRSESFIRNSDVRISK